MRGAREAVAGVWHGTSLQILQIIYNQSADFPTHWLPNLVFLKDKFVTYAEIDFNFITGIYF